MDTNKRKPSTYIIVLAVVGTGLIVLGGLALTNLFRADSSAAEPTEEFTVVPAEVGFPAPELNLTDLEGKPVSLAETNGQVVLINNWAFWCTPCREELPVLQEYYQDHKDQDFVIIGIDAGSDVEDVVYHVDLYKLTYPNWLDPKTQTLRAFRNNVLPNSYVIDRDGQVRLAWTGPISRETLEQYVTPLLEH